MPKITAIDSIDYRLEYEYSFLRKEKKINAKKYVKTALGVGIEVDEPEKLTSAYNDVMNEVFKSHKIERKRKAYCASSLAKLFGDETFGHEKQVIDRITSGVLPFIARKHFFYTYLFGIQEVSVFGRSAAYKKVPVVSSEKGEQDFYDLINPSYSLLCAWKYLEDYRVEELMVDNFQGHVSPAWNEFYAKRAGNVYFTGDECNYFISTADILLRKIKLELTERLLSTLRRKEHHEIHFTKEKITELSSVLGDNVLLHFLGKTYLPKIAPHEKKTIHTMPLARHPVFFLVRERPKLVDEREIIETTPAYDRLLNMALEAGGCLKFFQPSEDAPAMQSGDRIVTFGTRGEQVFDTLQKSGVKGIQRISSDEIV